MTQKKPSLASFVAKTAEASKKSVPQESHAAAKHQFTLRLTPEQRVRLKKYAAEMDTTIQALAIQGLSRLFEDRGLPPL